jgi:hypothetical protein
MAMSDCSLNHLSMFALPQSRPFAVWRYARTLMIISLVLCFWMEASFTDGQLVYLDQTDPTACWKSFHTRESLGVPNSCPSSARKIGYVLEWHSDGRGGDDMLLVGKKTSCKAVVADFVHCFRPLVCYAIRVKQGTLVTGKLQSATILLAKTET